MSTDWERWLARYGADYNTDTERADAFEQYLRTREGMKEVFKVEVEER